MNKQMNKQLIEKLVETYKLPTYASSSEALDLLCDFIIIYRDKKDGLPFHSVTDPIVSKFRWWLENVQSYELEGYFTEHEIMEMYADDKPMEEMEG